MHALHAARAARRPRCAMARRPQFHEFWTRALEPGRHFLPPIAATSGEELCEGLAKQVQGLAGCAALRCACCPALSGGP